MCVVVAAAGLELTVVFAVVVAAVAVEMEAAGLLVG